MPAPVILFAIPAAAKALLWEYLPLVSSTSLTALLLRIAWSRLPSWLKDDVVYFQTSSSSGGGREEGVERLSTVLEKVQAWMQQAAQTFFPNEASAAWNGKEFTIALLLYFQLYAQLKNNKQREINKNNQEQTTPTKTSTSPKIQCTARIQDETLFALWKHMLDLATIAYYVDDESDVRKQLQTAVQLQQQQQQEYELLRCYKATRPGSVGYFVARNQAQRTVVIAIRGTSSIEELLTDACGRSVSYHGPLWHKYDHHVDEITLWRKSHRSVEVRATTEDEIVFVQSNKNTVDENYDDENENDDAVEIISGHERIICGDDADNDESTGREDVPPEEDNHVRCHEGILLSAQRLLLQVQGLVEDMVIKQSYKLVLVGHSLGASAACLLAVLLRSIYPELDTFTSNVTDRRLQVYAFAPPPVLDHDSAIAASSYVTSFVHQSDFIPRCSLANGAILCEFLRTMAQEKAECFTSPHALIKQLALGDQGDPFWTHQQIEDALMDAEQRVARRHPDHLYVPGKLYLLRQESDDLTAREITDGADSEQDEAYEYVLVERTRYSCELTDVTAPLMRILDLSMGTRMLGDHTTTAYHAALDALLEDSRAPS